MIDKSGTTNLFCSTVTSPAGDIFGRGGTEYAWQKKKRKTNERVRFYNGDSRPYLVGSLLVCDQPHHVRRKHRTGHPPNRPHLAAIVKTSNNMISRRLWRCHSSGPDGSPETIVSPEQTCNFFTKRIIHHTHAYGTMYHVLAGANRPNGITLGEEARKLRSTKSMPWLCFAKLKLMR